MSQWLAPVRVLAEHDPSSLKGVLVRGVSGTLGLKVTQAGLGFVSSVVLARLLGTDGLGTYAYALSWVTLLGVAAKLGQDQTVTRHMAAYREKAEWGRMRGLLRSSFASVLVVSLILVCAGAALAPRLAGGQAAAAYETLLVALLVLPLHALSTSANAALVGLGYVVRGQLGNGLISPSALLLFLALAAWVAAGSLTPTVAMGAYVAACALAFAVVVYLLTGVLPSQARSDAPKYDLRRWLASALPVTVMGGMYVLNANVDILMVGSLAGTEAAGIYKAATRGADLVALSLMVINPALGPVVVRLHLAGDRQRLQRGVTRTARVALALSLPITLALMLFGEWFLLLFGQGFSEGRIALAVLAGAQLVNVAAGSVGVILVMTGDEALAAAGVGASTLVNVVLNLSLIPIWGIEGAALATAVSILVWNASLVVFVWRRLGIDPTVLGIGARMKA